MTRINPFDLSRSQGAGNVGNVNSPEKLNQNPEQKNIQNTQNIGDLQKTDEDTMVDASSMVDDTEGFDMSGFDNEDKNNTVTSSNKANKSEQGDDNDKDKEKMMAQAEEMLNNFFDKKNAPEE